MSVRVDTVEKTFQRTKALDRVSFEVGPAQIFALLGPNGAGKSTMLEILEGYVQPDSGEVRVLGLDPQRQSKALKKKMGLMLQEPSLYPGIRVGEVSRLFASFYDTPTDPDRLLRKMGLHEQQRQTVRSLSRGEAQKLSLLLALVGNPSVLFLDEPTAGMDVRAREDTWQLISELNGANGTTVVLTTHLLEEAEQVAELVAIIDRGQIRAFGTPSDLTAAPERIAVEANHPVDFALVETELGLPLNRSGDRLFEINITPTPELMTKISLAFQKQNNLIRTINAGSSSLQDVFLKLTSPEKEMNE